MLMDSVRTLRFMACSIDYNSPTVSLIYTNNSLTPILTHTE